MQFDLEVRRFMSQMKNNSRSTLRENQNEISPDNRSDFLGSNSASSIKLPTASKNGSPLTMSMIEKNPTTKKQKQCLNREEQYDKY